MNLEYREIASACQLFLANYEHVSRQEKTKKIIDKLHELTKRVIDDEVWVPNSMLHVGGSKTAFRCECGCNVFSKSATQEKRYRCNGCLLIYNGE